MDKRLNLISFLRSISTNVSLGSWQRSHFCLVEIQSGTSLDHGIENTLTGSGLIGQPGRDTGNPQEKTGE